jgi:hypothetical protein
MELDKTTGICTVFILAIILLLVGCAKESPLITPNETTGNESSINVSPDLPKFDFIKVKSIEFIDDKTNLPCHYSDKLRVNSPIAINDSKIVIKFELINFSNDSAKVKINDDKEGLITTNRIAEVEFNNGAKILFAATLFREDYAVICVNTNEEYDVAFCDSKLGSDRFMCFDNLGYLNGVDYCDKIQDSSDKADCRGGALGTNG